MYDMHVCTRAVVIHTYMHIYVRHTYHTYEIAQVLFLVPSADTYESSISTDDVTHIGSRLTRTTHLINLLSCAYRLTSFVVTQLSDPTLADHVHQDPQCH